MSTTYAPFRDFCQTPPANNQHTDNNHLDLPETLSEGIFARHALYLHNLGLATLPGKGKIPAVNGWYDRTFRYGESTVLGWRKRFPAENVLYQPGLSIIPGHPDYCLIVIDSDDLETAEYCDNLFGVAPGTDTRRGRHNLYALPKREQELIAKLVGPVSDLRHIEIAAGVPLNVDIKHGNSIVVAPPSAHPEEWTFCYEWRTADNGSEIDADFLAGLPEFPTNVLADLVSPRSHIFMPETWKSDDSDYRHDQAEVEAVEPLEPVETVEPAKTAASPARERRAPTGADTQARNGSRKLCLNDYLVSRVSGSGFDALLVIATTHNDLVCSAMTKGPLEPKVVETIAQRVWNDHLQKGFGNWSGGPPVIQMMPWEVSGEVFKAGTSAITIASAIQLLGHLRACHGAQSGKRFIVHSPSMKKSDMLPGWHEKKYRVARQALEAAGLLVQVARACSGVRLAAEYKLVPARQHPLADRYASAPVVAATHASSTSTH